MTSMNLVLRPSTKGSDHKGSLSLRLIHNRQPKTITLKGCRIYKSEWDDFTKEIIYPADNPKRSVDLEDMETRVRNELELINGYVRQLQQKGRYTVNELLALYKRKTDDGKLLGFTDSLTKDMESNGQIRTAGAYRTVVRGLVAFNGGEDIPLNHINSCLIRSFERHLKDANKMPNTVAYYIRNLRAIYNKAIMAKRIFPRQGDNPFAGISTAVTKTVKRALTLEELQALYKFNPNTLYKSEETGCRKQQYIDSVGRSQRYFFFCFFARGMSFVDLAYLRKENIRGGLIRYTRKKTGQQIEVNISRELQAIIDSFADDVAGSPYVFPIIREQGKDARLQYESALRAQNGRLKVLAAHAGVSRSVTTHVARHSWASVGKLLNIPVPVLSDGLGHTTQVMTSIYLAQLENRILDDANELISRAVMGEAVS